MRVRCVTLPIASIQDATWQEFQADLDRAWQATTNVANWMALELLKRDHVRTAEDRKLPALPGKTGDGTALRSLLYREGRTIAPELATQAITALEQNVYRSYRKARYDVLWRRAASPRLYRYPVPVPIHNQGWAASVGPGGESLVSFRLLSTAVEGARRWTVRLRGGKEWRRQLGLHRAIVEGVAKQGELSIYRRKIHEPGQNRATHRLMAKIAAGVPDVTPSAGLNGDLVVRTSADGALLVAEAPDAKPWILYGQDIRAKLAAYDRRREQDAVDLKYEKRTPKPRRVAMLEDQAARGRRMNSTPRVRAIQSARTGVSCSRRAPRWSRNHRGRSQGR